jgi:hypothetical protein
MAEAPETLEMPEPDKVPEVAEVSEPPRRNTAQPLGEMSGIAWLKFVINDPDASLQRKDRCAQILAGIEARKADQPGKKVMAQEAAKLAGWGTHWWRLLHDEDAPDFDPNGLPEDEREEWLARQAKKRQDDRQKSVEQHSLDEILKGRYDKPPGNGLSQQDDGGWGNDLDFRPSGVFLKPPDDE